MTDINNNNNNNNNNDNNDNEEFKEIKLDENNPQLITDYNKIVKLTKFLFPYQKGVDKSKLMVYDVCVYSITQPLESKIIAQTVRDLFNAIQNINSYVNVHHFQNQQQTRVNPGDLTITDTTANIGGNTLAFSFAFKKVNSIEINETLLEGLNNNCNLYKCSNIDFHHGDCLELVPTLTQDVIFFDPPWGGPSYKNHDKLQLFLGGINIFDIIKEWKSKGLAKIFVLKYPFNFDIVPFINEKTFDNIHIQKLKKFNVVYIY
jgi:hypothetical protein